MYYCFSLPDSPAEPDPENQKGSPEEPRVIPHDEVQNTAPLSTHIENIDRGTDGLTNRWMDGLNNYSLASLFA